ncbi:MAG: hypothetical protein DI586_04155 [Micavibrio aeruginosavorus]|uniref:Polysaccharide export protein N-terminal domain-containing protein n=1 Tax=Micavibrio aeruginosavorus TaxID=349221 RepID=A0A2W5HKW5_9BACT|nr:MAG: hypothetical protein DI586_04155 [Micavibrio aeruginosavorus]
MKKYISLLSVPALCLLLSSCTLTPPHFDGYDLLDTEHKTEHQDPVIPPAKEHSDGPIKKISVPKAKAAPVVLTKAVDAPVKKPEPPKPVAPEKPPEKAPVKTEHPPVLKTAPKESCVIPKKGDVPPPAAPTAKVTREKLQSGDRVKITVFREKDLSGIYQINDKGLITFPLLGQVTAAGMKSSELQVKMTSALAKGYLVKPEVNVELLPDCLTK